jgi:hypothetical protein
MWRRCQGCRLGKVSADTPRTFKRYATIAAAGLAVISLAGCTVNFGSVVAVGVDTTGAPVAVMLVCHGHIDRAGIYRGNKKVAQWTAIGRAAPVSTWTLASGGDGWTVNKAPLLLDGVTYEMDGWTKNNSWSAVGPDFTLAQLHQLEPGQVLYSDSDRKDGVAQLDEFTAHGCEQSWGGPPP